MIVLMCQYMFVGQWQGLKFYVWRQILAETPSLHAMNAQCVVALTTTAGAAGAAVEAARTTRRRRTG